MKFGKWKALIVVAVAAAAMAFLVGTAAADEGPHGGFTATTGKCQGCHSPHRASSIYILRGGTGTIGSFCTTCHSASGDAHTDVLDGQWTTGKAVWGVPDTYGDTTRQLNGGRFTGATATHAALTDATGTTIWGGNNTTGADVANANPFRCTDCHDPHGNGNYRMLENGAVVTSWESTANYGTGVTKSYTRAAWKSGMETFCTSCHADYLATTTAESGTSNKPGGASDVHGAFAHPVNVSLSALSGGNVDTNLGGSQYKLPVQNGAGFNGWYWVDQTSPTAASMSAITTTTGAATYSAANDKVTCTTCHNAHGTLASDDHASANAAGDPSLLRFDNRAVCQSCHKKGI